jgi:aspartyl-tRNA(Asn)/glutamyl-tRNA(Gln) amidotransferase subunit C
MPKLSVDTVDHVARLAQLSLTPEERELFARQLQEVLTYAETLQALDTASVAPMSQARTSSILREDEPSPGLERDVALAQAPDPADHLFRVPRVIGG